MTAAELKAYYQNLLILQYQKTPKALGTVGAFVNEMIADGIYEDVRDAFALDSAVGAQLDVIGAYRGAPRVVYNLVVTKTFMSFPLYASPGTLKGFAVYGQTEPSITWFFFRYGDFQGVSYTMNDQEYLQVLKFRADVHSSPLSVHDIDVILNRYFGTYVTLTDNLNMTITFNDKPTDPTDYFVLINESSSLPKPAGVQILITNNS